MKFYAWKQWGWRDNYAEKCTYRSFGFRRRRFVGLKMSAGGAAAGGFAVTGRASVIFAGVTGSAVISNSGTALAALGCGLIASGGTLGLVTGITGSSAISDGRADTVGLLFSIISAGGAGFGGTSVILTVASRSGGLIFP